ncbi:hypothetical protein BWD42_07010 [Sphingobacterium sp. CZ-UAM]|uniref:hypothetical protein n=1 Tax=Sphingobacterium sp. CZ-UAM TaxID=1933868 RepID=UPI00098485CF|nr:hypothetical protein [Sphingobacterium sp. CZ-UAM]OOG19655.1 hypothetical protein BWD42_07010 [Sphingobacterium sp. CZ-UAM]
MNENNLEYLKKNLEYLGFGKKLNDVLENAIRREIPSFSLGIETKMRPTESKNLNAERTETLQFKINFNRSKESDTYFLNNYLVTLTKKNDPIVRQQSFDLARDHRITALQAYKLLSGLSLEKEVYLKSNNEQVSQGNEQAQKTSVWLKLNLDITDAYGNHPLRTFRPEYGYDLVKSLAAYPIKDIESPDRLQEVLATLRSGNYYHTEMKIGNKNVPVSIAANPQIKTLDVYDKNMKELHQGTIFPDQANAKKSQQERAISADSEQSKEVALPWIAEDIQEKDRKRGR